MILFLYILFFWVSVLNYYHLIFRLWSFLLSACTPQFTVKDSTTDIISEAYKLLTEIWTRVQDKAEIPNEILERCERLAGKVYVERPRIEPPIRSVCCLRSLYIEIISGRLWKVVLLRLENIRAYFTTRSLRHVTKSILFDELIWD